MRDLLRHILPLMLLAACSCDEAPPSRPQVESDKQTQAAHYAADNTGRNVGDRDDATLQPFDQSRNQTDEAVTRQIRKSITEDHDLSINARNVKVITVDGKVALRGVVETEAEKESIARKAAAVVGVERVDNQLEVKS